MVGEVGQQSTGLCVEPSASNCVLEGNIGQVTDVSSTSRAICEIYLLFADRARIQLGLSNDSHIRNHALTACIHDYQTTNSSDVWNDINSALSSHAF
jgi:hypothetical protein